jgi:hypothetical protein
MNISALEQYVDGKNRWGALFGDRPLSLLNAADRQKIAHSIDADLSPENLSCDGELRPNQVRSKYDFLTRVASELKSIDPQVEFYEI